MILRLVTFPGTRPDRRLEVPESVILGRAPADGIALSDSSISSEHCRVFMRDGRAWIEDLDSTNGTEVNGVAVKMAELKDGDRIRIGGTEMLVENEPVGEAVGAPGERMPSGGFRRKTVIAAAVLLAVAIGCVLMFKEWDGGGNAGPNMLSARARRAAIRQFRRDGVRLTVQEPIGVARKAEPVTSGVPLPEGSVRDVARLRLFDSAKKPVPCQFQAQSRWPDGSIKWVLLDFQADVGASNRVEYLLRMDSGDVAVSQPVKVLGGRLETGNVRLAIGTNAPGLIHGISFNGTNLVMAANPVQAVLVDGSNRVFKISRPDAVAIETEGPMRSTVRVSGHFVDEAGKTIFDGKAGCDLRVTVYAGKPYVRLDFTLKNDGWYGYRNEGRNRPRQWLYLKSLRLNLPVAGGSGPVAVEFAGRSLAVAPGQRVDMTQWLMYPLENRRGQMDILFCNMPPHILAARMEREIPGGFHYTWTTNGVMDGARGKAPGWVRQTGNGAVPVSLAARRFWQNFPMGFSSGPDGLSYVMLPEGGCWPRSREAHDASTYQFEGGRRKTATLLLTLGEEGPDRDRALAFVDAPLFARAPAEWYRDTGAVVPLAVGGVTSGDRDQAEAMERYDRLQRAKVNAAYSDPVGDHPFFKRDRWGKISIPKLQKTLPDIFSGFMNYGDLVWSFGYCSLYYGWPYSMLQHYLRLGDREFLDVAEDMIRHRYDIDQYHVENTAPHLGGFQRYEKGEHGHLRRQEKHTQLWEINADASHTWNRCLLFHWALTGDPRSLAAAEQNGRAFHRFLYGQHKVGEKAKLPWNDFRVPVWAIDNWLALYEYTGEPKYLAWANEVFDKTLLAMERDNGSRGHILKDGKQGAQFTGYMVEPICRLHHLTGRQDVIEFLKRVLDWQRKAGIVRGVEKDGVYYLIMWREYWDYEPDLDEKITIGVGNSYHYPLLDGYAYLYRVFGRPEDLEFSRRLFREAIFHIMTDRVTDRSYRSPLGYHHLGCVFGSTPKLRAWDGRYCQIYLYVEELAAMK